MNVVDQFLSKVGKQTLLTSKAMMNGFLPKEEAEELERLRAIDFEIDMQALSFWERHNQAGIFRSKFDINGVNRIASPELLNFVNRLTEIEIKYEISDFLYHVMVLMVLRGVTWEDIVKELANR